MRQSESELASEKVPPPIQGMHIQREGIQHWLVIDKSLRVQIWPKVRRFLERTRLRFITRLIQLQYFGDRLA
ncbi:hypothetical protein [Candidatus Vallotia lariciata]|uniref:hypothetical protein n=1 Tax=Candidatus Vallotia laricis TaxID=2018052 RepID=UPI001D01C7EF|nr:hypothetical protein [Candidatus Vallotia lariciata]UDG83082.1 hypothetical protein GKR41_00457 [Candidatus Vallotia lariciata]